MNEVFKIQTYNSIKDLYKASGFDQVPKFEDFDLINFIDTYPSVTKILSPHKRNFYSLLFIESQDDGQLKLNTNEYQTLSNVIICQSFEHIFSFIRGESMKGFVLLFNDSFLLPFVSNTISHYTFFSSLKNNVFHLNEIEKADCNVLLKNLSKEVNNRAVSKHLLLAFLEKIKIIQEQYQIEEKFVSKSFLLLKSLQQLINNFFLEHKNVEFYAQKLNVTPNHLNETVKQQTGKNVKSLILERGLLEAKKLLLYSNLDIAEVSYYLNYSEPSHFGKFFKKETGFTPKEFRRNP
ncbi:MAG: helix-turn-helix domain-containing protein [Leadbetterella sp.]